MRIDAVHIPAIALAVVLLNLSLASAQSNPSHVGEGSYKETHQQQQQQTEQPQPTRVAFALRATAPHDFAAQAPVSSAGDCCSADAMKKIADSLGFVDIVGIKLGMTPQQAVAAVKAYSPNLKIEVLTAKLYPSGPQGSFLKVPYSINAHTANTNTMNGPVEWIALEFTTPPNPPVVATISPAHFGVSRRSASNAFEFAGLLPHKSTVKTTCDDGGDRAWVFDTNGKLLTRTLTSLEKGGCVGDSLVSSVAGEWIGGPPIRGNRSEHHTG